MNIARLVKSFESLKDLDKHVCSFFFWEFPFLFHKFGKISSRTVFSDDITIIRSEERIMIS